MYVVKEGPYSPELKLMPMDIQKVKMLKKIPTKMKMLPQSPVGMSNTQTSAKFVPVAKRKKKDKIL